MASYQTFPQADETKQSPGKKPSMIAVIVAAFCLGAAYVSSTSTGPRVYTAAATPAANDIAPNEAATNVAPANKETCTITEFQREVALDVEDTNGGAFGTSNDGQTLAKSFKVKGENGEEDKYFLHFYDATTGEEKRDPIPLWFDASFVAVTNANDRAAICYASSMYGVIDIPCIDRGNDTESCTFKDFPHVGLGLCSAVAMAPDEQTVAFSEASFGGSVRLLKTYSPQEAPVEFQHKPANAEDGQGRPALLAYSPDGTLAVAGESQESFRGLVAMYDGTTGELLERADFLLDFPKHYGALAYSNDGQVLALGGTKFTRSDYTTEKAVLMLYDVSKKTLTAEIDLAQLGMPSSEGSLGQVRAAWSPDDKQVVGNYKDLDATHLGVFDAATGALLDKFKIDMGVDRYGNMLVDFVGFTGDRCGDACHDLVVSSEIDIPTFANNLNYYDILTLDASDSRCQPTPAPVPAPHHSDGATALAAGLAVPALAALAL